MFKLGHALLFEVAQKPSNEKKAIGHHENIFIINSREGGWDPSVFIQNIHAPKPRVSMPTQHLEVCGLSESNEEEVYETWGGYLLAEASDGDFWGENGEENF